MNRLLLFEGKTGSYLEDMDVRIDMYIGVIPDFLLSGRALDMRILKVINNNVVSSVDENQQEVVIMGKGVGFQKKKGDEVEQEKIEKIFCIPRESSSQFEQLVRDMPYAHMQLAEQVIGYAKEHLKRHLNKNIYITLTDHLNFAVERKKQGAEFENALLWEIQRFYREEYQIGLKAIEMVKERLGVELPEDEAGFIALHIVNAEMDGDIRQAGNITTMIKDMINIVRYTFGAELDESSLSYERFVTHLKFFVQRAVQGETYESDDMEFNRSIQKRYPMAYECALKLRDYAAKKLGYEVSEEEVTYLTVHIARVIRRDKEENTKHM